MAVRSVIFCFIDYAISDKVVFAPDDRSIATLMSANGRLYVAFKEDTEHLVSLIT